MKIDTAVSTAALIATTYNPTDTIQFLLVVSVLVLLTMVYTAWNAKFAPSAGRVKRKKK